MANTRVRLTVAGNMYYQIPGSDAVHIPLKYDRGILTPEQPYERSPRIGIGNYWTQLDLGWFKDGNVGTIIIRNLEKPHASGYPQESDLVIELGYGDQEPNDDLDRRHFKIPPGECQPVYPSHPQELYIRCKNGTALYSITVLPQ